MPGLEHAADLIRGDDGALRCWWAAKTPSLAHYHDVEWGRGSRDEAALFERLSLEAFQAGLSWQTVLERRDRLREAFAGFVPEKVALFDASDAARLSADAHIIRNRAKITAVIENARLLCQLHDRGIRLGDVTDDVVARLSGEHPARPPRHRRDVPATTTTSTLLATELRQLGWRFVGPTTAYAYLQAAGWVDDHLIGCHVRSGLQISR